MATASERIRQARKLAELREEANESAEWRGHRILWEATLPLGQIARGTCMACGCYVQADVNPPPNGIDIGGDAVALNCTERS